MGAPALASPRPLVSRLYKWCPLRAYLLALSLSIFLNNLLEMRRQDRRPWAHRAPPASPTRRNAYLLLWCVHAAAAAAAASPSSGAHLPYAQGGDYVEDAGAAAGVQAWYVDADGGSDANDGRAPGRAWRTAEHALRLGFYPPGAHVLFKRGTAHDGGGANKNIGAAAASTEAAPFVVGAYGAASLPLPRLDYNLGVRGEHVTARDLEVLTRVLTSDFSVFCLLATYSSTRFPSHVSHCVSPPRATWI